LVIPNAFYYFDGKFQPIVLGKTRTSKRAGELGPEVGFGLEMATAKRPVYLIKFAASGMPLHHGWNGARWVGGAPAAPRRNFYPGENTADKNKGALYLEMLKKFRGGIAQLKKEGHTPVVRGFAWMQGEQDSKKKESALAYATSLRRLCRRLGEDVGLAGSIPTAFGQVLPHQPAGTRFTHRKEIRAQMVAADAASGHPIAIKNVKMVSTDGFGILPDTVHYNAIGQLRLGREFAKALKIVQAQ